MKKLLMIALVVFLASCIPIHEEGQTSGVIQINGSAFSPLFSGYTVSYGVGKNPTSFSTAGVTLANSGTSQVNNSLLATIDSKSLIAGLYTVKLEISDTNGAKTQDFLYLNIDNIVLTNPANQTSIDKSQGTVSLKGTVYIDNFVSYAIRTGTSESTLSTTGITLANGGTSLVDNAELATWDVSSLAIGEYVLELKVTTSSSTITELYKVSILEKDSFEPDDTFATASTIVVDGPAVNHTHLPQNDSDMVKFTATAGDVIQIESLNLSAGADTIFTLFDTDQKTVIDTDDEGGDEIHASKIIFEPKTTGTYYVNVTPYLDTTGIYSIKATKKLKDSFEPDNSIAQAKAITTDGSEQIHNFLPAFDQDYISFAATAGKAYDILTFNETIADTEIFLQDSLGNTLIYNDYYDLPNKGLGPSRIIYRANASQTLYVKIEDFFDQTTDNYSVKVSEISIQGDVFEPDNTFSTANTVGNNITQLHNFSDSLDTDFVTFTSPDQENVEYQVLTKDLSPDADTMLFLYNGSNELNLIASNDQAPHEQDASNITFIANKNTQYWVAVRSYQSIPQGSYSLSITSNQTIAPENISYHFSPTNNILIENHPTTLNFSANVTGSNNQTTVFKWFVNDALKVTKTGAPSHYQFVSDGTVGNHSIKVQVEYPGQSTQISTWTAIINGLPNSSNFNGSFQNITIDNINNATGVDIHNTAGSINFGSNSVDLGTVGNLDNVIMITADSIGIDSNNAPGLNRPAQITFYNVSRNKTPTVYVNEGFGINGNTVCTAPRCTNITWDNLTKTLTFNVSHFSTFFIAGASSSSSSSSSSSVNDFVVPASITLGSDNQDASNPVAEDVDERIIRLSGTMQIENGLSTELQNITPSIAPIGASGLELNFSFDSTGANALPTNLGAGQKKTVGFQVNVPASLNAVNRDTLREEPFKVADINFDAIPVGGNLTTKTTVLNMQRENKLEVDKVEVCVNERCKTVNDGDDVENVRPGDDISIEIFVENKYSDSDKEDVDFDDVEIEFEIDDDDFNEDDSEGLGDLGADDTDSETFTFKVEDDVGDGSADVEIKVFGTDENGAFHGEEITIDLDVERENHDLVIRSAIANPSKLVCGKDSTRVTVNFVNLGTTDEDETMVQFDIDEFGIQERLGPFEVDEDDSRTESITLNLPESREEKTYELVVSTFYDTSILSHQEIVELEAQACETKSEEVTASVAREPQQTQEQETRAQPRQQATKTTKKSTSFENILLLAPFALLLLLLIEVLVIVALKKRGRI